MSNSEVPSREKTPRLAVSSRVSSKQVAKWLYLFSQIFRQEATQLIAEAYLHVLQNLTPAQLDRGCNWCLAHCEFFPTPAKILEGVELTRETPACEPFDECQRMTPEEFKALFAEARARYPELLVHAPEIPAPRKQDAVVEITDEMRARHEASKAEALRRFGTKS